ncbi:MAG TPA: hypothetical protein VGN17_06765 [Bryobacteraceae bacterium]|jgi:hypothetical protein
MRLLIAGVLLTGSCLLAQTSATGFGRMINPSGLPAAPGTTGFGRMIYPGTGGPPATVRAAAGTAGPNGGRGGRVRIPPAPPVAHQGHGNGAIVAYPVYYGGYYYPYDAPVAPQQGYGPDQGYDSNYGPSPVVIINQNFRPDVINPQVTDYSNAPLPQYIPPPSPQVPSQQPAVSGADTNFALIFLIAMKDHTIYPAVAYWVEGDTLNYVTAQGARNRISLELVDRDFSKQLNKERNVEFGLPDPPPAAAK